MQVELSKADIKAIIDMVGSSPNYDAAFRESLLNELRAALSLEQIVDEFKESLKNELRELRAQLIVEKIVDEEEK
jgi:hypothetical protein